jgi:ElaB/YqjD/DUF883 family membrane-anchored ribosome-binding protein
MVNASSANNPPVSPDSAHQPAECPPDNKLPENTQENLDAKLDHAIEETFPTSDPVSVNITKGGAIDYDQQNVSASATAASPNQAEQDTADNLLDQVREALSDVAGNASGAARKAYDQGERYVRQARERYPEAERSYRQGRQALREWMMDNPWPSLFVVGATGYLLAWMIHSEPRRRDRRVPDYARTRRGYAEHRHNQRNA